MTVHAHRIAATGTPRPPLTCWRYRRESRCATAFSTRLADALDLGAPPLEARGGARGTPGGRAALADIAVTPPRPCVADGRANLAAAFDRLPGLTVAAAPVGHGACLLGDRAGGTAFADGVPAELAAVAAYLWLATGRRLDALGPVHAAGSPQEPGVLRQPGCAGPAGCRGDLVVASGRWLLRLRHALRPAGGNLS